jgi:hypothetical protein
MKQVNKLTLHIWVCAWDGSAGELQEVDEDD